MAPSMVLTGSTALAEHIATASQVSLPYTIHDYSSHAGIYHPQHICSNKPTDQSSRWSSATHDQSQFITLRLNKPAIACSIVFGKFHRVHVCNIKEFKIMGGMDPNDLIELLHQGLRNDTEPETFPLRHTHQKLIFPVQYIKIIPLSTFGPNFNYSIWHVDVKGIQDEATMVKVLDAYQRHKEMETIRLCLKHFRQRNMMDVFELLSSRTGIDLEHPYLTQLHQNLVLDANFDEAERILSTVHDDAVFNAYTSQAEYKCQWRRLGMKGQDNLPRGRGGHQMCIDERDKKIYLLGGWSGGSDLADFWCYHINEDRWELISMDTSLQNGPSARSCHKICFDPESRSIFVLGRYVEASAVGDKGLHSDFYRYLIDYDHWVKISDHTAAEGGPELLFDHQMCIDTEAATIYVFGGRTVYSDPNVHSYSGMYSYNIPNNTWTLVREDGSRSATKDTANGVMAEANMENMALISRVGHATLFDPTTRDLYIFSGQRLKEYLSDLYRYSIDNDHLSEIVQDYSQRTGPDAAFTQRATFDPSMQEIHVLSGYMRNQGSDVVKNAMWVYNIAQNRWYKVYQNENHDASHYESDTHTEPRPRYAHQMVYDTETKKHYIFGGNPGDYNDTSCRLDDFWELQLIKPNPADIFRKCIYMIRLQKLRELCRMAQIQHQRLAYSVDQVAQEKLKALQYLRDEVAPMVDHANPSEKSEFYELCSYLCQSVPEYNKIEKNEQHLSVACQDGDDGFSERVTLFENILTYFPPEMKEPSGHLTDAVKLT